MRYASMMMSNVAPATPTRTAASRDRAQRLLWVDAAEKNDRGHHKHAGQPQPRAALAKAAEQRDANVVDERRPEELEVVREKGQREHGDRALLDPVLRESRGQRGADHCVRRARRDTEEESRQRRTLDVRAHAFGNIRAPVATLDRGPLVVHVVDARCPSKPLSEIPGNTERTNDAPLGLVPCALCLERRVRRVSAVRRC